MRVHITCNYCDLKWEETVYSEIALKSKRCMKCKDKNLRIRDLKDFYIDTYIGCPPFPKDEDDEDKQPILGVDDWGAYGID